MSDFDQAAWDRRWADVLRTHGDQIARREANHHLADVATPLAAGRALDAGCGNGTEALWLAGRGWEVTAVDFANAALEHGRATASALGDDVAARVEWVQADLGSWSPTPDSYDLVVCLYVHVAGSVAELVQRLATGVTRGGTLLMVGHLPIDVVTGAETRAAGQVQVTVAEARAALDPDDWEFLVAEDRLRPAAGSGHDAVICVRRR